MKIDVSAVPDKIKDEDDSLVGNVYRVEGGGRVSSPGRLGPRAQVVIARGGDTCYTVTFSLETGEFLTTGQCSWWYFSRKKVIGRARVDGLIDVEWLD